MLVNRILLALIALTFLVICTVVYAAEGVATPAPTEQKVIRLLTVGNSFADNSMHYFPQVCEAGGYKLILFKANLGGCSMERHWNLVKTYEANPEDPKGKLYNSPETKKPEISLKEALTREKWDFVTIQQLSAQSPFIENYRPYARNLYDYIKQHAPQAEVLLHETWAYRPDAPFLAEKKITAEEMYTAVSTAYRTIATELGVRIIPVGDAFHLAATHPDWQFKIDPQFDPKAAVYPHLPDQAHSLNAGWRWSKDATTGEYKLVLDANHANTYGEYIGACAFFEVLTGKSVLDITYAPQGINENDARFLRQIAHQAVENSKAVVKVVK